MPNTYSADIFIRTASSTFHQLSDSSLRFISSRWSFWYATRHTSGMDIDGTWKSDYQFIGIG